LHGEATWSQELHTTRLPRSHVLGGYWWQHTRLCLGYLQHNSDSCDFVSQPPQTRTCTMNAYGSSVTRASTTLRQQHRNVLAYLTEACQAAYTGEPAPSLLPLRSESYG